MNPVFSFLLAFSGVVLASLWWVQQRQKRQIRQLLARLEAVETEREEVGPAPSGNSLAAVAKEQDPEAVPTDDVLAGYTTYVQRVVSGPGDTPMSLADQAIVKIHQHLDDGYRPAQLANDLHISLRTLERGLSDVFDCSPGQLITAMKMREARRLLVTREYRVNEVASRLGFSSPFYFSRRFRTFFGVSPSQYRQAGQGGG